MKSKVVYKEKYKEDTILIIKSKYGGYLAKVKPKCSTWYTRIGRDADFTALILKAKVFIDQFKRR